jgi:hypothetical protein
MPNVDDIVAWEDGTLTAEGEARFFQELVDTGAAWELQGMYGRRAVQLIASGAVKVDEEAIPPRARELLDSSRGPA